MEVDNTLVFFTVCSTLCSLIKASVCNTNQLILWLHIGMGSTSERSDAKNRSTN